MRRAGVYGIGTCLLGAVPAFFLMVGCAQPAATRTTPALHTEPAVQLGYFSTLIERFAAAETLQVVTESPLDAGNILRSDVALKRPRRLHITHDLSGARIDLIGNGNRTWALIGQAKECFTRPGDLCTDTEPWLFVDLFFRARDIADGKDLYGQVLAAAKLIRVDSVDGIRCDVVEIPEERDWGARTFWMAQATHLPICVGVTWQGSTTDFRVTEFLTDAALDDALFSFAPTPEWTVQGWTEADGAGDPATRPAVAPPVSIPPENLERLRALGYLSAETQPASPPPSD